MGVHLDDPSVWLPGACVEVGELMGPAGVCMVGSISSTGFILIMF